MKLVGVVILFLTTFTVFGGVYMEDEVKNEKGIIVRQTKTWIESDKLRVDVDTLKEHHTMIYLVSVPKILIINRADNSYFVMGPQQIAMTKQMFQMQKQKIEKMRAIDGKMMKQQCESMKKQQQSLPKEKQAAMNPQIEMVCGGSVVTKSIDIAWQKNGTATIGKWKCSKWVGKLGKKKVAESCNVTTKSVGVSLSDFSVFKLIEKNFSMLNAKEQDSFVKDLQARGVPVNSVTYEAGVPVETTKVIEIKKKSFPPTIFQTPKGMKEKKNPVEQRIPHKK